MIKKILMFSLLIGLAGCTRNVSYVKERAEARWKEIGYTIAGYEGYQWSIAGGDVWYVLKRNDSPGVVYTGYLKKWGDELHVYGPKVVSGNNINLFQGESK